MKNTDELNQNDADPQSKNAESQSKRLIGDKMRQKIQLIQEEKEIESFFKLEEKITCDICQKESESIEKCSICKKKYCNDCGKVIKRKGVSTKGLCKYCSRKMNLMIFFYVAVIVLLSLQLGSIEYWIKYFSYMV